MAQFFARIKGARGPASRLGHKTSGIQCEIMSWTGMVTVDMWFDSRTERDMVRVVFGPHWDSSSMGTARMVLYHGPCSGWRDFHDAGDLGREALRVAHQQPVREAA